MFPKQNTFVRVNSLESFTLRSCARTVFRCSKFNSLSPCGKSQLRLAALLNVNRKLLAVFWSLQFSN